MTAQVPQPGEGISAPAISLEPTPAAGDGRRGIFGVALL